MRRERAMRMSVTRAIRGGFFSPIKNSRSERKKSPAEGGVFGRAVAGRERSRARTLLLLVGDLAVRSQVSRVRLVLRQLGAGSAAPVKSKIRSQFSSCILVVCPCGARGRPGTISSCGKAADSGWIFCWYVVESKGNLVLPVL
jgi:hypothetical protein